MPSAPPLLVMDYVGPVIGAVVFVVVMSLVKEPGRHTFNAILVAGASMYLSGGFEPWELVYPAIVTPVVYLGPVQACLRHGGKRKARNVRTHLTESAVAKPNTLTPGGHFE
jgi:uncharacterized protein DUF6010